MRILIDISHPAHVHVFRNAIGRFRDRGHQVCIVSRDKDLTVELLDGLGLDHQVLSTAPRTRSRIGFVREMLVHCYRLLGVVRRFRPDVLLQVAGTFIAPVGFLLRRPAIVFYDTEFARLSNAIAYPLATAVCTPECYRGSAGRRQVRYPGYHELAYLHPSVFTPDPRRIAPFGLTPDDRFFVVRFVGWAALHDYDDRGLGLDGKRAIVSALARHGRVLISSEGPLPADLERHRSPVPPLDIHHAIAYASLVIGESATMASEAAVLGVPAIYVAATSRGYTSEQEERYGLVRCFTPAQLDRCLEVVRSVVDRPLSELRAEHAARRQRLLAERISTTDWMVEFVEALSPRPRTGAGSSDRRPGARARSRPGAGSRGPD